MPNARSGRGLSLDDLSVGMEFLSGEFRVEAGDISAFASQYDPQPFHLDEALARHTIFEGLAASGWHTAAITMKLLVASVPFAEGVIGAGAEISWPRPTRAGDVLHVRSRITDIRPSKSQPGRATVSLESSTCNQGGEVVQRLNAKVLAFSRAPG